MSGGGFFAPLDERPAPEPQEPVRPPPWAGPPQYVRPAVVALDAVLLTDDARALGVDAVHVYPEGVAIGVELRPRGGARRRAVAR